MATYRFEAKIIGRSQGRSATASAAYRAGQRMEDSRTGQSFDYTRKRGVLHTEILAPAGTPDWMHDRAQLWNAVEAVEKRKDAQLARDLVLSLPHELTPAQRIELVQTFVRSEFVSQGMIADIAVHAPDRKADHRNHHAHVMLTMRQLTGDGFGKKVRDWNAPEQLEAWRAHWAEAVNRDLERYGHAARVDHRSLADQGLDREPEPKQGPVATEMERNGMASHAGDDRRAAQERNSERAEIAVELESVTAEIIDLQRERARRAGEGAMAENPSTVEAAERAAPMRQKVGEPSDAEAEGQQRREALLLRDLAEQDKHIQAFKQQRASEAEQAREQEEERRKADERRAAEGDIASASDRYAQALGQHYDMRDPYTSLARAAMAEYAAFKRQQEDLRQEIAATEDPNERAVLELRRRIEGCEYMAVTSERLAGISATIAGREDAPGAVLDRERAEAYQSHADALREEHAQLYGCISRDQEQQSAERSDESGRSAERDATEASERRSEKNDRDYEVTDAKAARFASQETTARPASQEEGEKTQPEGRGRDRGGRD